MSALPFIVGALSPAFQAIGLFIWADKWKSGALELNAFKCAFASIFHLIVTLFTTASFRSAYQSRPVAYMILSSFLGIVIADTWWLIALARLGARRMIAIDMLKPFIAVAIGAYMLDDRISTLGLIGIAVTSTGVFIVTIDKSSRSKGATTSSTSQSDLSTLETATTSSPLHLIEPGGLSIASIDTSMPRETWQCFISKKDGVPYLYAIGNVVLDVFAAALTVSWHKNLSSADVNLIRFGFAGITLGIFLCGREGLYHASLLAPKCPRNQDSRMTLRDWTAVAGGVICVTVMAPLASTWVMFELPLAIALTLNSTAPIWSLPIARFYGESLSLKAICGAALATAGVVMLVVR